MQSLVSATAVFSLYMFLSVCVLCFTWWKIKQRTEVHVTLRRLIDSDREVTPEVIEAVRSDLVVRNPDQVEKEAKSFRYWGIFWTSLGLVFVAVGTVLLVTYFETYARQAREIIGSSVLLLIVPGLYCLSKSVILTKVHGKRR